MSNGIYIHIPFCLAKCAYCDFNSYAGKLGMTDSYFDALIEVMKPFKGTFADTVYIGGGTPTVFSEKQLEKLITFVNKNFVLSEDTEKFEKNLTEATGGGAEFSKFDEKYVAKKIEEEV